MKLTHTHIERVCLGIKRNSFCAKWFEYNKMLELRKRNNTCALRIDLKYELWCRTDYDYKSNKTTIQLQLERLVNVVRMSNDLFIINKYLNREYGMCFTNDWLSWVFFPSLSSKMVNAIEIFQSAFSLESPWFSILTIKCRHFTQHTKNMGKSHFSLCSLQSSVCFNYADWNAVTVSFNCKCRPVCWIWSIVQRWARVLRFVFVFRSIPFVWRVVQRNQMTYINSSSKDYSKPKSIC